MTMRKLAHETLGMLKQALVGEVFRAFNEGDRVMTIDGLPGKIAAVLDGPYPQTEVYEVTLDGGAGGGKYTAGQLSKLSTPATTAALDTDEEELARGDSSDDLNPIEATTYHVAVEDYPELGSILHERPPNEGVRVYASRTAALDEPPEDDASLEREEGPTAGTSQEDKIEQSSEKAIPAVEPVDPPDSCSFCGGVDFEDRRVRKGAATAVMKWVRDNGGHPSEHVGSAVDGISAGVVNNNSFSGAQGNRGYHCSTSANYTAGHWGSAFVQGGWNLLWQYDGVTCGPA